MPNQHVIPNPNGGWDVKGAGNTKVTKHFNTKDPAIKYAKEIAKKQKSELIEHGKNGKIISKDSFGNDPIPPEDKEH